MRYPAEETARRHQQIVAAASRLFRERGFEGVSVAELMAVGSDPRRLLLALRLKGRRRRSSTRTRVPRHADHGRWKAPADPRAEFIGGYLSRRHRDHPEQGCAMAARRPKWPAERRRSGTPSPPALDALIDRVPLRQGVKRMRPACRRHKHHCRTGRRSRTCPCGRRPDPVGRDPAAVRGHFGLPPEGNDAR